MTGPFEGTETQGTEESALSQENNEILDQSGGQEQVESPQTPLPETPATPAPKEPASPKAAFLKGKKDVPALPVAYAPNLKFRAVDKDHEMPEFLKGAIKDAETEKQLREVFEKAYGLDAVKPKYVETRQKYEELNKTHQTFVQDVQELREDYSRGDFDTFFKRLNIPEEKVYQWVLDKVQYQQLPADQRQVLDARKQAEHRTWTLEKQNQAMQQEYEQKVAEATQTALMAELERPDIKSISQAYDSRPGGKPGDFFQRVVERGEYAWYSKKVALQPRDAIQEAVDLYAYTFKPQTGAVPPGVATPGVAAGGQKKVPVIPNISGRPNSPMKAPIKSMEDIRNRYKQLQSNQ